MVPTAPGFAKIHENFGCYPPSFFVLLDGKMASNDVNNLVLR